MDRSHSSPVSIRSYNKVNALLLSVQMVAVKQHFCEQLLSQLSPISGSFQTRCQCIFRILFPGTGKPSPCSHAFFIIRAVASISDTDIRSFLHYFLFSGDDVFLPIHSLSYGERARLVLARLVAGECNFLLLDEPINHLDIPSRSSFEQAMTAFEGTVLTVVHDRYFIRNFATRIVGH